ncbi:MAG TPA: hypothetical protein VFW23_07980, partial [Tepidisphaeraceae bacterium]|nr:hypothetical protein [Tepidisphaeraceae bacterium]
MTLTHRNFSSTFPSPAVLPEWAARLVPQSRPTSVALEQIGATLHLRQSSEFSVVRAVLPGAAQLPPDEFQRRTTELYLAIRGALVETSTPHPVRFWNCLPGIHVPTGSDTDRYMTFNSGRFAAFEQWFGSAKELSVAVPSASAVGHHQEELVIHALACPKRGRAVCNPRQIAPYRYSRRFGPLPPCFARATMIDKPTPMILVGGTASIRGEDSVHLGELAGQTHETFVNLACLVAHACDSKNVDASADLKPWLSRFRELRVYYVRDEQRSPIEA